MRNYSDYFIRKEIHMKSVMIDNLTIEDIAFSGKNMINSPGFHNIIEAIILWDQVYYPNNEKSIFWKYLTQEQKVEKYISPCIEDKKIENIAEQIYYEKYKKKYSKNIAMRAIEYDLLANSMGCDYLPCKARRLFLRDIDYYKQDNIIGTISNLKVGKDDIMKFVDKTTQDRLKEFNSSVGSKSIEIKVPILSHYVIGNKPDGKTYFEYAQQLKCKSRIRIFSDYIENVEKEWEYGNFRPYMQLCNDINDIVNDINKIDKKLIFEIMVVVKIIPKIEFDIFDIRKYNISFVKKIVRYVFDNNRRNM